MLRRVFVFCLAALLTLLALPSFAGRSSNHGPGATLVRAPGTAARGPAQTGSVSPNDSATARRLKAVARVASAQASKTATEAARRAPSKDAKQDDDAVEFEAGVSAFGYYGKFNQHGVKEFGCTTDEYGDCGGGAPDAYVDLTVDAAGQKKTIHIGRS